MDDSGDAAAPLIQIDIVSLFPALFDSWLAQGVVSRAIARGLARVERIDLRPFGVGRHRVTDDYPFGGGGGMVLKPEPVFAAVESLALGGDVPVVLLSPRGRRFDQRVAHELSQSERLVLISGHYEGVDERIRAHLVNDELSIGDYVLSCGELAAMVVSDAVVRLLPGALSSGAAANESHQGGLLEYPHYTRPAQFRGWAVPDILISGHHAAVDAWRREQAIRETTARRPDMLADADLTPAEVRLVADLRPAERSDAGPD